MWGRTPSWRRRAWVRCHRHAATCEGETQRRHCPDDGAGPQSQEVRRPPCAKHGGGKRWAKGWRWRASDFKHLLAPTTASAGRRTAAPMIGWREVGRCSPYGRGVGAARSRWRCIQHSARVSGKQGQGRVYLRMTQDESEVETGPWNPRRSWNLGASFIGLQASSKVILYLACTLVRSQTPSCPTHTTATDTARVGVRYT